MRQNENKLQILSSSKWKTYVVNIKLDINFQLKSPRKFVCKYHIDVSALTTTHNLAQKFSGGFKNYKPKKGPNISRTFSGSYRATYMLAD